MLDFTGQVVVVTGAGRGLGRLYALELARRGAAVVVNDVGSSMRGEGADTAVADAVVTEIRHAGGTAEGSYDTVDEPEAGEAIVRSAVDRFGRLDAVVSNAGIFHTVPFTDLSPEDWRRMLRVHLDGAFHVSQPAFRVMQSQGYGRVVFIASSAGAFGQPQGAHYAAAKAGILGLAKVIALEGAEHGIVANCVFPFGYSRMVTETVGDFAGLPEVQAFLRAIEPELVVPLVVYLASDACRVTHHNFSAGAGRFSRVFLGLAEGWMADQPTAVAADDISTHLEALAASTPFTIPESIVDEVASICDRLGITGSAASESH
jgi:NAD(P)-dependent dehydrogenase (short-subunit alcohol dehydrogenase family)